MPAEVAMIGDNIITDVWGAQRLGMFSVWKPSQKLLTLFDKEQLDGEKGEIKTSLPQQSADFAGSDAALVIWAQQQAQAKDPRTATLAPPDAVITRLTNLLDIFLGMR